MTNVLADNITSPLGMTTEENYEAVKAGRSALRRYEGLWGLQEPFTASLFSPSQWQQMVIDGLTRFEALVVTSVRQAVRQLPVEISASNVLFVLSTTKANVELLLNSAAVPAASPAGSAIVPAASLAGPATAARRIARKIGITTEPVVVCNACISGVAAIILAQRMLEARLYDYAVVCGADVQNLFTVSGFQSLKAVSASECRPFDIERNGLNLGEAAATIVLERGAKAGWGIETGAIRNDAFHISSPSKNGEGAFLALRAVATVPDASPSGLAFINAHGTATMFNDQMEAVSIDRAGLGSIPVNALKGYYGHTLGAAGVLETILSIHAANEGTILATRGYDELGVSARINITRENAKTAKKAFVKMISGFGGTNAAILAGASPCVSPATVPAASLAGPSHHVIITPSSIIIDGKQSSLLPSLSSLYKQYVGSYPKFHKMDPLCQLAFIATEILLQVEDRERFVECDNRAVIMFNNSSSIHTDLKFCETIADEHDFFPSPSLFIYTLPNIVTGEIAIRNHYHGETSFFILPERDNRLMQQIASTTFQDETIDSIITGWVDYFDENNYIADLSILQRN